MFHCGILLFRPHCAERGKARESVRDWLRIREPPLAANICKGKIGPTDKVRSACERVHYAAGQEFLQPNPDKIQRSNQKTDRGPT
jgi:hypothetical protein